MPKAKRPRHGSLQFWPRKRASRIYARIRSYAALQETRLAGFAGYKVGMTHVLLTDPRQHSLTKGTDIFCPVTVIECPPLKVLGVRAYRRTYMGLSAATDVLVKGDKELERKISLSKKETKTKLEDLEKSIESYAEIRAIVYTQPRLVGFKKKPEIFELLIGGKDIKEKFGYAKQILGKEVRVEEVFREGQQVDVHAVTKGKGFQGPVKRFRVALRQHKAEKTKRGPATLGAWTGARTWTVAHAGQMGYHTRMEHNKWLIRVSGKPDEINSASGFKGYGLVRNSFVLVKGSVAGPAKRLIRLTNPIRKNRIIPEVAPSIQFTKK
jgi:large subunit ribosomal protein L3